MGRRVGTGAGSTKKREPGGSRCRDRECLPLHQLLKRSVQVASGTNSELRIRRSRVTSGIP